MRRWRPLAAILVPAAPFVAAAATANSQPSPAAVHCGTERWAVKTLTDPQAKLVNLTQPNTTLTVEKLRRISKPATWSISAPRLSPVETTSYQVKVLLMSMIKEADSDIHLVIADPKIGGSMIAEFPDPGCTAGASAQARQLMTSARTALAGACGGEPNGTAITLGGTATLTGVGFFDKIHGQGGVAPNGIELHPVIGVSNISCERVQR